MIVKSLLKDIFLPYVGQLGKKLVHNVETEVPDSIYQIADFAALIPTQVSIISFGAGPTDTVCQPEFSEISSGLYSAAMTIASDGIVSTDPMLHAVAKSVTVDNFDLRANNILMLDIDDVYLAKITIPKGFYTTATLVEVINGHTSAEGSEYVAAADHVVASVGADADAGKLLITSKAYGINTNIQAVTLTAFDANDIIQLADSAAIESAQPETLTVTLLGPTGKGVSGGKVTLGIYSAATEGALVATSQFQRVLKGKVESLYENEIVAYSDDLGLIELEVIDTADANVYVQCDKPTNYAFALVPSARQAITVTQV